MNQEITELFDKGRQLNHNHDYAAIEIFRQIIEINSHHAKALFELGKAFQRAGIYHEAKPAFERSILEEPSNEGAWDRLSLLYEKEGRISFAKYCIEKARDLGSRAGANRLSKWVDISALKPDFLQHGIEQFRDKEINEDLKTYAKLQMYFEKPGDLGYGIKKIIESDWPYEKQVKWISIMQEMLEDWKTFEPSKFEKAAKTLLPILSNFPGGTLIPIVVEAVKKFYNWLKERFGKK